MISRPDATKKREALHVSNILRYPERDPALIYTSKEREVGGEFSYGSSHKQKQKEIRFVVSRLSPKFVCTTVCECVFTHRYGVLFSHYDIISYNAQGILKFSSN